MHKRMLSRLSVLGVALSLAGCNVGPNFVKPSPTLPAEFIEATPAARAAPITTQTWSAFNDPVLNALIERALVANTTIAQAQARLDEVRAFAGLTRYSLFPTVTAASDAERNKASSSDPFIPPGFGTSETFRSGFDALWEIDLFGSLRRQSQSIKAQAQARESDLAAARQAVVAEVAQAYFAQVGGQRRVELNARNVANLQENIQVLRQSLEAGRGTDLDVSRANAQGLSVAAQLPLLRADVARQTQRLAALTAQSPADVLTQLAAAKLPSALPELVPVGQPIDWLKRRPDVRAAEDRLRAATADVGAEVAEYYPKLTLNGGFGWTGQRASDLFSPDTERWRFGPGLSWRFLDFGRVRQNVEASQARQRGAEAAFNESVLLALEECENALAGMRAANENTVALQLARSDADNALRLAKLRYDAGVSDYLVLLDAERTFLSLSDQAAVAEIGRVTALAALYKALAGDFAQAAR